MVNEPYFQQVCEKGDVAIDFGKFKVLTNWGKSRDRREQKPMLLCKGVEVHT